jgi:PPOX class probable F420-dependent enzyme
MVTDASRITGWAADPNALADFLDEPNLARLGTVDLSGEVHLVPAWYAWDGERLSIGADAADHKVANVRRTGRASVEIDGDLRRKRGILVHGPAVIIDGDEGHKAYEAISILQVRRYQPDRPPRETAQRMASKGQPVVIEVRPERIISWGR